MTDKDTLRDARLAQALKHMPDAHMQPGSAARLAVLKRAQEAVAGEGSSAPVAIRRWWKPTSPAAWGGTLASVLVASFTLMMWHGQPVPDAEPDGPVATTQETAAAPPAKEIAASEPTTEKPALPLFPAQPLTPPVAQKKREAAPLPPPAARHDMAAEVAKPAAEPMPAPSPPSPPQTIAAEPPPKVSAKSRAADGTQAQPFAFGKATSAPSAAYSVGRVQGNLAEPISPVSIMVTQDGKTNRMGASQAAALLAALRALPYETQQDDLQSAADNTVFTVQSSQGEVWDVGPRRVLLRSTPLGGGAKQSPQGTVSMISDAQWQELRGLAGVEP